MSKNADQSERESAARQPKLPLSWDEGTRRDGDAPAGGSEGPDQALPVSDKPRVQLSMKKALQPLKLHPHRAAADTGAPLSRIADAEAAASSVPAPGEPAEEPNALVTDNEAASLGEAEVEVTPQMQDPNNVKKPDDVTAQPRIIELGQVAMTVGQRLLEARGAANMTVAQVSQKTRVPKHFIELLEMDRLDELPPFIYTRSHVNQLCNVYGVDSDTILKSLAEAIAEVEESGGAERGSAWLTSEESESGARIRYRPPAQQGMASGAGSWSPTSVAVGAVIVGLALLVLAALGVQQYRYRQAAGTTTVPATAVELDMELFIVPQQLPLTELSVPEK